MLNDCVMRNVDCPHTTLIEGVVESIVEDAARAQHVDDVVIALCILVAEGEARKLIIVVSILRLGISYQNLLADIGVAIAEVDDVDGLRAEQLINPVGHSEGEDARVSLEGARLADVVVTVVSSYESAFALVGWRYRVSTGTVEELLDAKAVVENQDRGAVRLVKID